MNDEIALEKISEEEIDYNIMFCLEYPGFFASQYHRDRDFVELLQEKQRRYEEER